MTPPMDDAEKLIAETKAFITTRAPFSRRPASPHEYLALIARLHDALVAERDERKRADAWMLAEPLVTLSGTDVTLMFNLRDEAEATYEKLTQQVCDVNALAALTSEVKS